MSPARKKPKALKPKVFTIAAGVNFVDALAAGIAEDAGDDALALARVTVLVPTRRARRTLAEAFLRLSGGTPLLLPRMVALGDLDEDEVLTAGGFAADVGETASGALDVDPAVPGLRRQLLLTRLVLALPDLPSPARIRAGFAQAGDRSPDQAANLARELAALLDQVHTERLGFDGLGTLVPDGLAEHWQQTLEFLKVLTERWPEVLEAERALDPADRRNRLFEAQARAWQQDPPESPVIAAGSTGSIPATADLLAVVAGLPRGAVVLPGLDLEATDEAWDGLEEHHPQFGMARLLARLGVTRMDVRPWPAPGFAAEPSPRARLVGRALTPAGAAEPKAPTTKDLEAALAGVTRLDCPGPREEAAAIALVMRRTLESPAKTAALVTPDRALARRVAAELDRWTIGLDDSAGVPLDRTGPGAFLLLTARMVADDFAPVALLAALKHPLASGGMATARFRALVRSLEAWALRGARPGPGVAGLRAALAANPELGEKRHRKARQELDTLLDTLEAAAGRLTDVLGQGDAGLTDAVQAHAAMAEALAATDDQQGARRLWDRDAGEKAASFVAELLGSADTDIAVTRGDYPALLETLLADRVVRPRAGRHPRLHVWGLLEARLQQADVMILGGLNEDTWPPEAKASPWMSRPMLKDFGLPAPERRIGLAAHDFQQAFAAPEVVLTRAARVEGAPSVPSRWLLRLDNLLERLGLEGALAAPATDAPWLGWVAGLDAADAPRAVTEPRPAPPVEARPRELSVTRIETWVRDPYALYAERVLGLKPLDPLDAEPGAAERGIVIHEILDRFHKAYPADLPEDPEGALLEIGRAVFAERLPHPGVRSFWWPRFEHIVDWFASHESERRAQGFRTLAAEVRGAMEIAGAVGKFTLTARADRIDRGTDGQLSVIDYKTGAARSARQVAAGLAPQLPLEAAIAEAGGFEGVEAATVRDLVYLRLTGGRPAGRADVLKLDVAKETAASITGLTALVKRFEDPAEPYPSRLLPMRADRPGVYDHLARVKEWHGPEEADE